MRSKVLQLAARARGLKRSPRRKPPRVPEPRALMADYLEMLLGILRETRELVTQQLLPALPGMVAEARASQGRMDEAQAQVRADASYVDALNKLVQNIVTQAGKRVPSGSRLEADLRTHFQQTNEYAARGVQRQVRAVLGFDVVSTVPGLEAKAEAFVQQNVGLIKTLPNTYLHDIEQAALRAFRTGKRAEDLAQEITQRYDVASNRAALIARDQIGKLNGEIVEDRQRSLGIDGYIWSTSEDERVRPEHEARDGESFKWSEPPEDGHPGQAINCRCSALPDLTDLLG